MQCNTWACESCFCCISNFQFNPYLHSNLSLQFIRSIWGRLTTKWTMNNKKYTVRKSEQYKIKTIMLNGSCLLILGQCVFGYFHQHVWFWKVDCESVQISICWLCRHFAWLDIVHPVLTCESSDVKVLGYSTQYPRLPTSAETAVKTSTLLVYWIIFQVYHTFRV